LVEDPLLTAATFLAWVSLRRRDPAPGE